MQDTLDRVFIKAHSLAEALGALKDGARVLAGGTWLMRDPLRGIALPNAFVTLDAIPGLAEASVTDDTVTFGAGMTHAALALAAEPIRGFEALASAARSAANPAIRTVATLGGNLCSIEFAAADLVPALLVLGAEVQLASADGRRTLPLDDFLKDRTTILPGRILLGVSLTRTVSHSAHVRLPLRKAGDYPVAIVSVARGDRGDFRVAIGSVEAVARRWSSLEAALAGEPQAPDPFRAADLAERCMDFDARDGSDADGWYRCQVLPALVRRAFQSLETQASPK